MEPRFDFDQPPFIVIWETTQACDLSCVHGRPALSLCAALLN